MPVTDMDMYERENLQQDAMKELVLAQCPRGPETYVRSYRYELQAIVK